ncbi:competence type IV pilus minor pilin ComGD [Streptococcus zalophi]|uniref:Type II secretion system protein n=1 Tax=Streptococcus zalophi TaxID=640031 RepID=A0A934PB82_9STRE|nr:competence type IV pilus minor pilin ComGD [Streptococcus zalophi]MBJ8350203.1 type II secretion system protein [Streptococcus zalophi]
MLITQKKPKKYRIKAFTLLESLLTLATTSFLVLSLFASVSTILTQMEERLFFLNLEYLYQDTQKLSLASQKKRSITFNNQTVSTNRAVLKIPQSVHLKENLIITFNQAGGNSSLKKIIFETDHQTIRYQLYIGSGKYKKDIESLHSP